MRISLLIGLAAALMGAQSAPPRKDIPAIAKAANGAIVSIIMSDKDGHAISQGTGFLISKDGRIVTNYHVIESGSSAIVKLPDGAFYVVDGVLAFDKARDVAVIKAHGENFRTLTLGNSDQVQVGEEVVAIGSPLSLESTVSNGIVSGIRTEGDLGREFLQVTTPISPGSSGGPLFNMAGEVVGITTLYLKGGENLNFAIPINDAKHLLLAKSSELQNFPNENEPVEGQEHEEGTRSPGTNAPAETSRFTHNKRICLDGVLGLVQDVLPDRSLGPEYYQNEFGKECSEFIVQLPLSPEDAQLLEGRSPEDDTLLSEMEVQRMNATSIQVVAESSTDGEGKDTWAKVGGAIWQAFETNRKEFCSHHRNMLVFDLDLDDGNSTIPTLCSDEKNNK
jgi:V8-like Glu-specific endopeptidase